MALQEKLREAMTSYERRMGLSTWEYRWKAHLLVVLCKPCFVFLIHVILYSLNCSARCCVHMPHIALLNAISARASTAIPSCT